MPRCAIALVLLAVLFAVGCAHTEPVAFDHPCIPDETPYTPAPRVKTPATPSTPAEVVTIHKRSEWADAQPMVDRLDPMGQPTRITVHHEGVDCAHLSGTAVCERLRAIRSNQIKTKAQGGLGAGDIGYHFVIDSSGAIWEGRPMKYQGAHAGNFYLNQGNIGVCLLGDFNVQRPTPAQKASLRKLLAKMLADYHIPDNQVFTHRELKQTDCPGTNLQTYMNQLRPTLGTAGR